MADKTSGAKAYLSKVVENQKHKHNLQQLAAQNLEQEKEIKKLNAELAYLRSDRETLKNTIVQMVVSKYGY